jgi:non-heme chloroperoxidase
VPDLRGHGDTDWAPDGDYSADAYAGDLAALIRELRLEGAPLIGNSLGGMTAAHYVAAQPADEQPRALVLVDVGPEMREGGRRRLRAFTDGPREMASVDDFVERALHFNPRRRPELLRRSLLHNLRQTPAGTWTWKYDPDRFSQPTGAPPPLTVEQRWADMLRVFSPTLVVRGGRSDMFLDEDAERLAEALPNGRWIRIEGASHTVQGDQPLALTTAIRDFLKLDSDADANSNSAPLRAAVHEDLG